MSYYSFTLTIPLDKKVYYCSKRRKYGSLNQSQQHKFLSDLMTKSIWISHFDFVDYVFESHADSRLHIHGYVKVNPEFENLGPVERLVDNFYTVNSIVGIKPSVYKNLSNIQKTYCDISFWQKYIDKHQNEIIYKSPYRSAMDESAEIDRGVQVVHIETRPQTIPPDDYYDTYRFTGETKKFFVEI